MSTGPKVDTRVIEQGGSYAAQEWSTSYLELPYFRELKVPPRIILDLTPGEFSRVKPLSKPCSEKKCLEYTTVQIHCGRCDSTYPYSLTSSQPANKTNGRGSSRGYVADYFRGSGVVEVGRVRGRGLTGKGAY